MIRPLAEVPQVAPILAGLMRAAWPGWYGADGPGDAEADLQDRSCLSGLPFGMVALSGGRVLGGAALLATSHGAEQDERPWIGGLLVAPVSRGQGIGSSLLAACEDQARRQGFACVLVTTRAAREFVLRRGWQSLRRLPGGHEVLRKKLE